MREGSDIIQGEEVEKNISTKEDSVFTKEDRENISYSSLNDGLINFKITKIDTCQHAEITVSIVKNNIKIIQVDKLRVSGTYTTKNIPTYAGSTIKIKIKNLTDNSKPEDCIILMKTQDYTDKEIFWYCTT